MGGECWFGSGNITIKRVYHVEGLKPIYSPLGQFCDADLEVSFRKSICYIRDLKGNDLLTGSRGTNLYSITFQDTFTPNPICIMAKASPSQAWLWHHRLLHLNFDTINLLSKYEIVTGLPKLKFVKDHLYSSCEWGERKTYTWTHFLRSKDETPVVLIDFLKLVQRRFHAQVRTVRTDKGTEFLNKTLHAYFAQEGIEHQMLKQLPQHVLLRIVHSDGENLDKMKEKGDACIFVGYSTQSRAVSDYVSSDPVPQCQTTALEHDSLSPSPQSQENVPQAAETSFAVPIAGIPDQRQQHNTTTSNSTIIVVDIPPLNIQTTPETTSQAPTQAPTVTATENINQAETNKENAQVDKKKYNEPLLVHCNEKRGATSRHF
ncbi:retrovirus-related pol polyprotein from transposon TNT 1-94 [Tanacetum coccineum]